MADRLDWKLDEDKTAITGTFPTEPPMRCKLKTAAVDDLLCAVGMLRARMLPQHSHEDPRRKRTEAVINPPFAAESELMNGDILFHIRDPRFGTLSFMLPRERARQLGQSLIRLASAPRAAPASGKAS
jgi:hypothetical protein